MTPAYLRLGTLAPVVRRTMSRSGRAASAVLPAPWGLVATALLGPVAVVQLPALASLVPSGDRLEPNEAQQAYLLQLF